MPRIPGVNHKRAVRALERAGFKVVRQGKHIVMSSDCRILTIPRANPVNAYTLGGIDREAAVAPLGVQPPLFGAKRCLKLGVGAPIF